MLTISQRRTDLGLTQAELAERSGISISALQKWERGDKVPTVKLFRRLAAELGCTMDEIELVDSSRTDKR